MSWSTKTKIEQEGEDEEILTPDYINILVGASEDQILLYQVAFLNWGKKTKIAAGSWQTKTKIEA